MFKTSFERNFFILFAVFRSINIFIGLYFFENTEIIGATFGGITLIFSYVIVLIPYMAFIRYFNVESYSITKIVVVNFIAGLIFPFVMEALTYLYLQSSPNSEQLIEEVFRAFHWKVIEHNVSFYVFTAVLYTYQYLLMVKKQEHRFQNLELQLNQAELKALKYQLNPHFLFNSLNSINAYILENPQNAQSMLIKLSDFLRFSLHIKDKKYLMIDEELEQIQRYMDIEKIRFEDRIDFTLTNNTHHDFLVPTLLLQPLIENSIKHGVTKSKTNCRIEMNVSESEDKIHISIYNDVNDNSSSVGTKTGLENVRKRLQMNFENDYSFKIDHDHGFKVSLSFPKITEESE